jgi:AraC-like DNA-binding protein
VLYLKAKNLINSRNILRKKYVKEITLKPKDITINNSDENFLNDLINIIEEHISDNDFKIEDFARQLGMSHSGIYKKTKYLTDLSLIEFIRTIKLKKAREYLLKTDLTISQVSYEVGFSDPKYFSKCFQKYFGKSPSQYFSDNKLKIS